MSDYGATFERFTLGVNNQRLLEHISDLLEAQCQMMARDLAARGLPVDSIPSRPEMLHFDRKATVTWRPGKGPRDWLGRRKKNRNSP